MKLLLALMLLLQDSASAVSPDDHCPTLPDGSNLTWSYHHAQEFGVCYAIESLSGKEAFGVYLGSVPRFDPSQAKAIGNGSVGGYEITWYELSDSYFYAEPPSFSQETLIDLDRSGRYAHVWVTALSQEQFAQRLSVLKSLKFR